MSVVSVNCWQVVILSVSRTAAVQVSQEIQVGDKVNPQDFANCSCPRDGDCAQIVREECFENIKEFFVLFLTFLTSGPEEGVSEAISIWGGGNPNRILTIRVCQG